MSARAIEGAPEMGHLQPHYQGHDNVSRAVLAAVRMSVTVFTKSVLPLVILTVVVIAGSPVFSGVFSDQPVSGAQLPSKPLATASLIPGSGNPLPKPPTKPLAPQKSKYKVTYAESPIMAWSRMIHEDTSTMRSQLNTPLPTALDPTSYAGVNRRLFRHEQSLKWSGSFNKVQIGFIMAVVFFVVILPWLLLTSDLVKPRQAMAVFAMAVLAVTIAAQPLQLMTLVQASKAYVVDKSFRGNSFEALQFGSQQELVDKPAAQAALGRVGLTPKGVEYVTSIHNGDPVSDKDILAFNKVRPNPVESNAVATFSLLRAVIDADLQRPFIAVAVGIESAINVVLNPLTAVIALLMMIASTVSRAFRRHVLGFVLVCAGLYAALAVSVLFISVSALASMWLGKLLEGANIGPLTTIFGVFGALGIMWAYRWTIIEMYKVGRQIVAFIRHMRALMAEKSRGVISGSVVHHPQMNG